MSSRQVGLSDDLRRAVDHYAELMPSIDLDLAVRSPFEVYRVFFVYVSYRLRMALQEPSNPAAYSVSEDFASDLTLTSESLASNGGQRLARLVVDARVPLRDTSLLDTMVDVYHQAGGMCMSASPEHWVVDPECRVWGTSNLYVGGAAIFPSSGHANTTFTALALAARLAATIQSRDEPQASRLEEELFASLPASSAREAPPGGDQS